MRSQVESAHFWARAAEHARNGVDHGVRIECFGGASAGPQYISSEAGGIREVVSPPVPMQGNHVVLDLNLLSWEGTDTLQYEIQGSHAGEKWFILDQVAAFTPTTFKDFDDSSASNVTVGFLRMAARLGSANADSTARISAAFVYSQQ